MNVYFLRTPQKLQLFFLKLICDIFVSAFYRQIHPNFWRCVICKKKGYVLGECWNRMGFLGRNGKFSEKNVSKSFKDNALAYIHKAPGKC